MLEPLGSSFDEDQQLDGIRKAISESAERLALYAQVVVMTIEKRCDDRAKSNRDGCAEEFAAMNDAFRRLGRMLLDQREDRARRHFSAVGTKDHTAQEEQRLGRLQEEAEADGAAVR